jgi:pimeloyl-ACP methyl ester carboxylesterase
VAVDAVSALLPGPWEHRYVAANGSRFHVAEMGEGPLVLLVHGFPQFWWTWRAQMVGLAEAGYRAVAVDLRGYGASDKPPLGYDAPTMTADLAAVIRSLGVSRAVIVGQGVGGWLAWGMPALAPDVTSAVAVVGMAHPRTFLRATTASPRQALTARFLLELYRPYLTERQLSRNPEYVESWLRAWSAPGSNWPDAEAAATYASAMAIPFSAHSAVEAYRWMVRAPFSTAGRRYLSSVSPRVHVPLLQIHGTADPVVLPEIARRSRERTLAAYTWVPIEGAGHFLQEEAPDRTTEALVGWLRTVAGA